jgi:uncharacterized membrane protein YoaK (UPF0700 family)
VQCPWRHVADRPAADRRRGPTHTAITGLIDAVSYLRLGRLFVSNMTGNVVARLGAYPNSGPSAVASLVAMRGSMV